MSSKAEKDKAKQLQDKCQAVLNGLLRDEDNKYCVDCDSKGPRWASWNIGVFLCIRCAGIHRNLGVHISKVKSVNLDSWTPEQVVSLQQMGNSRARAVYEANLPDNFRRPQSDSSLETFIRAKYEHKKYIAREWVPPALPKVDWEKEIDEEIEKQRRKRKTTVERKPIANVEVPQLPKPRNPSPKPGRAVVAAVSNVNAKKEGDFLGLQNGEDSFSSFLSAPVALVPSDDAKKEDKTDPIKSEEESFFNQTVPAEKEKVKLTKDSILALYSNTPAINNYQFQSPAGQITYQPGTNFAVPQPQAFPSYAPQNFPAQNGVVQYPNNMQFPNQQFPVVQGQAQPMVNHHPHPPAPNSFQNHFVNFQTGVQFPATIPTHLGQFAQTGLPPVYNQGGQVVAQPNPFFSGPASLQQQLTNLSLNNQTGPNAVPTLASNLFQ